MKKILLFVILIALIIVGVPYYSGMQAEHIYRDLIDSYNKTSKMGPLKIHTYERGIWSSNLVTEVPLGFLNIKFQNKILHGPIIFDKSKQTPNGLQFAMGVILSAPDFSETPFNEIDKAFGDEDPLSCKSIIAFNRSVETFFYSPSLDYKISTGGDIHWKGLQGQFSIDKDFKIISGTISIPGLLANTTGFGGEIQGVNLQFDQKLSDLNFWLGKTILAINKILVNNKSLSFEVTSLKLDGETSSQNQLLNLLWSVDLTKVVAPSGTYGPVDILIKLLNMDPDGLKLLGDLPKDQITLQQIPKPLIRQFLLKTPTIVVENTKLSLPEGNVTIDAKFSVGGPNIPETFDDSIYLSTLNGNLTAELPKQTLENTLKQSIQQDLVKNPQYISMTPDQQSEEVKRQMAEKLDRFKKNNMLTELGDSYTIKFSVTNGKIMVEGKEIPVSEL